MKATIIFRFVRLDSVMSIITSSPSGPLPYEINAFRRTDSLLICLSDIFILLLMQFYRKTILNIEIRIDNINSVYFSFLFFIIQAIAIKQSEIVTYNIIHYKLRQYTKYQEKRLACY